MLLQANDICFSYKDTSQTGTANTVRDISLEIYKGEFLCLLGPSGCGKTTLLRLFAGLEHPSCGSITMPGTDNKQPKIGMVFQDLALFPHMSVARNVGYALRHLPRRERRGRTNEMLELVGLLEKRSSYPHQLSGGQQQRLALARALARQPDLILLDEPFAAQDSALRAQIRDDVMHILRDAGVAALLVTHDPEEAMQFSDRIAIMRNGHIEQVGCPVEVYNQPKNAFVASFFGQVNRIEGHVQDGKVSTSIGTLLAPDLDDNTPVTVIIRPEAFSIHTHDPSVDHHSPDHLHVHGIVSEHKYLGRSTLVHLDTHNLDNKNEEALHIHARIPGAFSCTKTDVQDVFLDHSQVFIFAKDAA